MIKPILAAVAIVGAVPASAAAYLPVGPQTNVALSTVTGGGWSLCYSGTMATIFGSSASTTLADCSGNRLLLAGRATGSQTLLVLAQTTKVDALNPTGAANNGIFTTSNGADWFYNDNWSWGFKPIGVPYSKFECGAAASGMCIHTLSFTGGYSINTISGLNSSTDYEKLVFTSTAVPEAATWVMLIAGFGLVGAVQRRRAMSVA